MNQIYLSRRNLTSLLAKLDGVKKGIPSELTLIKQDKEHPTHPQSIGPTRITAVEDEVYYADRPPGPVREDYMNG